MKIIGIETILLSYRYQPEASWSWSGGKTFQRNCVIVKISTDEGISGLGEIGESAFLPQAVRTIISTRFEPMLFGENPFNIEKIWQKMYIQSSHYGRRGIVPTIISGIDIALYDIIGKKLKRPVYDLIGGMFRSRFRVYASGGMAKPIDDLAEEAKAYIEQGYFGLKVRIGKEDPHEDIELIRQLRDRIGSKPALLVDAGQCYTNFPWTYDTAYRVCKQLEQCDLYWLEEPLHPDDIEGFKRLTASTSIPIVAGENEFVRYGFEPLITQRAVDMVQPDVTRSGGISECKKIADLASAHHMRCAPHIFGSGIGFMANMHFIASTPNVFIMEHDKTENPLREALMMKPIEYKDGYINLIQNISGLGVTLDEDIIRDFPYIDEQAVDKGNFEPLF